MQPKPTDEQTICAPREILLQAAMIRLGNVDDEIQAGYNVIRQYHKTVTVFGSARVTEDNMYYIAAREAGKQLAVNDYAVITGGGHGIMEAANRGAKEAGGISVGFNIKLPKEQTLNEYTTSSLSFSHFAPRKIVMTLFANAYIYFPGGFGTMDELTEILTLMQTGKTAKAPIILYGSGFWSDFDEFVKKNMDHEQHLINRGDEKLYRITDSIEEMVELVRANQTYCEH